MRAARADAEIALRLDDDYGETVATVNDPHEAWNTLERRYGSQQSGIQAVINAGLTLAKWDGQTPITAHRDHMKVLRTRLAGAGLSITDLQFYVHFVNLLPANYDIIIAVYDPSPIYSIDTLCEHFCAIELRKELRTSQSTGGTIEDPPTRGKPKGIEKCRKVQ